MTRNGTVKLFNYFWSRYGFMGFRRQILLHFNTVFIRDDFKTYLLKYINILSRRNPGFRDFTGKREMLKPG